MPSSDASVDKRFLKQMPILHAKRLYLITAQQAVKDIRHGWESGVGAMSLSAVQQK